MKDLKSKTVVITGAGSGMGRAYALAFARRGCHLALCDYDASGLKETVDMVDKCANRSGCSAVSHAVFDVSDKRSVEKFADKVKDELGNAHIVINNAGIEGSANPIWATEEDSFRHVMNVNYYGVVYGTQAFLPQLLSQKEAAIVNISSIFGLIGTPNHADYCASKFAVRGFTESLMTELNDSPVQVHLVHPGGIDTNISRKERSQSFSQHYLTTSADDIAERVVYGIAKNQSRIVYGNGSTKTEIGARLLPLTWLKKFTWHEMKKVIDLTHYDERILNRNVRLRK